MKHKTTARYTKQRIKEMLKDIQATAFVKVYKALDSGSIADDSEFLQDNSLLALTVLENATKDYKIKTKDYRKEADNIQRFI